MTAARKTTTARKREETGLLARIRLAVGARPDFLVTRINTGVFEVATKTGRNAHVRSAPTGFPDLIGTQLRRFRAMRVTEGGFMRHEKMYWRYVGQAIAIETKSQKGKLSEEQRNWAEAFTNMGGIYILALTLDTVLIELGEVPEWSRTRPCPVEIAP